LNCAAEIPTNQTKVILLDEKFVPKQTADGPGFGWTTRDGKKQFHKSEFGPGNLDTKSFHRNNGEDNTKDYNKIYGSNGNYPNVAKQFPTEHRELKKNRMHVQPTLLQSGII
jgi:hypothetical protein